MTEENSDMAMGTTIMAMGTTDHKAETTPQKPTMGIGTMGKPDTTVLPPAEPMLPPDIDPILLVRVYPGADSAAELRAEAMAAGKATQEAGAALEASMEEEQEPAETPPPTPPAPAQQPSRVSGAAHQPATRADEKK
jgi:hypothetical protein